MDDLLGHLRQPYVPPHALPPEELEGLLLGDVQPLEQDADGHADAAVGRQRLLEVLGPVLGRLRTGAQLGQLGDTRRGRALLTAVGELVALPPPGVDLHAQLRGADARLLVPGPQVHGRRVAGLGALSHGGGRRLPGTRAAGALGWTPAVVTPVWPPPGPGAANRGRGRQTGSGAPARAGSSASGAVLLPGSVRRARPRTSRDSAVV